MSWRADVPFTGDKGYCSERRGCGRRIGWVRKPDGRAVPVELRGWRGVVVEKRPPKGELYKLGWTLRGERFYVVDPAGLLLENLTEATEVVFESHHAFCPRAGRFKGAQSL